MSVVGFTPNEMLDLTIAMRRWVTHLRSQPRVGVVPGPRYNTEQQAVRSECADVIEHCLPVHTASDLIDLAAAVEYVHTELEIICTPR